MRRWRHARRAQHGDPDPPRAAAHPRGARSATRASSATTGVAWTYAEFHHRVTEIAAGLRAAGVKRGDVVGVVLRNGPEYLEVWWAILWLGAVFNPVNPDLTAREAVGHPRGLGREHDRLRGRRRGGLRRRTATSCPRCASSSPSTRPPATRSASLRGARHRRRRGRRRAGRPRRRSSTPRARRAGRRARCSATATSCRTRACSASCCRWSAATSLGMVLPLFHVNAQVVTTVIPLLIGAEVAMWERFSASTFWATVARFEPVTFSAVPDDARRAAARARRRRGRDELAALRDLRRGAALAGDVRALRGEVRHRDPRGLRPHRGHLLLDAQPVPRPAQDRLDRPAGARPGGGRSSTTDGRPSPARRARARSASAGRTSCSGYLNRPDATAETLRDGWLHTGDVGYRDDDGYFFLVDRKKDMIIRGGENIYPREIEDVLLEHDAVPEAAVVGRPDEVRGEEVHAVVVLAAGRRAWTRSSSTAASAWPRSRCRRAGRSSTSCPRPRPARSTRSRCATGALGRRGLRRRRADGDPGRQGGADHRRRQRHRRGDGARGARGGRAAAALRRRRRRAGRRWPSELGGATLRRLRRHRREPVEELVAPPSASSAASTARSTAPGSSARSA